MYDQRADEARIAETHFGFRRMHVGIDFLRIQRDEQCDHGMPVARQIVRIGRAHSAENQLVPHRATVDEQILSERIGAGQRRSRRKAFDSYTIAFCAHFNGAGAKICTQNIAEPR